MKAPAARSALALTASSLFMTSGCPSYSTMGSARVLDPGRVRLSPALSIGGAETDQKADVETLQPQLELGVSAGVIEDLEIGARVWSLPSTQLFTIGGQVNAKVQLYRPDNPRRGVHVALAPRLGFHHVGGPDIGANIMSVGLPLLIGITFGDQNELVFGPQVNGQVSWMEGASDIFSLSAGASVGGIFWVSDCFAIVPEASVQYSTLRAEGDDMVWLWQVGLGVLFDLGR